MLAWSNNSQFRLSTIKSDLLLPILLNQQPETLQHCASAPPRAHSDLAPRKIDSVCPHHRSIRLVFAHKSWRQRLKTRLKVSGEFSTFLSNYCRLFANSEEYMMATDRRCASSRSGVAELGWPENGIMSCCIVSWAGTRCGARRTPQAC